MAATPEHSPETGTREPRSRHVDGATFILDVPHTVPAVWGRGQQVLWAQGEPFYLVSPTGAGKTTLAGQIVLHRLGIRDGDLLGLPVERTERRVLYLAMDRPAQIARSLRRGVGPEHRDILGEKLDVWTGPLPFVVENDPREFFRWIEASFHDIGTVIIDSLKDFCLSVEKGDSGAAVNNALQECVAEGIEVGVLHHGRKAQGDNRKPSKLDDVYGSAWLTAGAGSVVLLWGKAGDTLVELSHLKQPAEKLGPFEVQHDHSAMRSSVKRAVDPVELARRPGGVTARALAVERTGSSSPEPKHVQEARRVLDALVDKGVLRKQQTGPGRAPVVYRALASWE